MIDLRRDGSVFVLTMQAGENRFNRPFLDALNQALDTVEGSSGPAALVTTGGQEKFYSTGLDLDWLGGEGQGEAPRFVEAVIALFARVAALDVPTVAAINGHAFAAGGMLALAHDFRVMRADRGFWCLPEVDINIPFTPGMSALIQARLAPQVAHEAMVTGRRYGGHDALATGIVDRAVDEQAVRTTAIEMTSAQAGKAGETIGTIKSRMYAPVLAALLEP